MKRVDFDVDGTEIEGSDVDGAYVLYEEARQIEVDRDIKSANLKTLVDMVLDHEGAVNRAVESGGDGGDVFEAEELHRALLALARGLKQ